MGRDNHRARAIAATLVGLGCWLANTAPVAGQASLTSVGGHPGLQEQSHGLRIDVDGIFARVEATSVLANKAKRSLEALYTFALPGDAAVTGLDVRLANGKVIRARVLDAAAALRFVARPARVRGAADAALLRVVERQVGGTDAQRKTTYELRVYPIPTSKAVTAKIRWVQPLRYSAGRLALRLPERGGKGLARERVRLTMRPPTGARGFGSVYAAGKRVSKQSARVNARFLAPPRGDLVIEAAPRFTGKGPQLEVAAVPFGTNRGAVVFSALRPPPKARTSALRYERVLFLVDVSRSMGSAGMAASRHIVEGLLTRAPAQVSVEVVTFDRAATRMFGRFLKNDPKTRQRLLTNLLRNKLDNGSDLGAALDTARTIFKTDKLPYLPPMGIRRGLRASTLIVIVSDGFTPMDLIPRRASDRLGDAALKASALLSVTLVPDVAPTPDLRGGPLAHLARMTNGRVVTVRYGEARQRSGTLAAEMVKPAPLRIISLAAPVGTTLKLPPLPTRLQPGHGIVAIGSYTGKTPAGLTFTVQSRSIERKLRARAARARTRDAARALGLTAAASSGVPAGMLAASQRWPVVTPHGALVGLVADGFARDRVALASRWGASLFRRLPPPPEREAGHRFRRFREHRIPAPEVKQRPYRKTGSLDRAIVRRLLRTYVFPKAKACYQRALSAKPNLTGSLILYMEIARGEVQQADIRRSTFTNSINDCVEKAAYGVQVPRVAIGSDPERVSVVRYPLGFRVQGKLGRVVRGKLKRRNKVNLDDPLGGLRR